MRYTKFEIKNYKGIKNLSLELNADIGLRVFTLVGLNESGKSTILEAINHFQEISNDRDLYKWIPKSERFDFNDEIAINAEIALSDFDEEKIQNFTKSLGYITIAPLKTITISRKFKFEKSEYKSKSNTWGITLKGKKVGGRVLKSIKHSWEQDSEWQKIVKYIKDYLLPTILYYPNFLFNFPEKIYIDELGDDEIENKLYKDVVQDILYSMDVHLSLDDHLLKRLRNSTPSNKEALDQMLLMMGNKITSLVFQSWTKLFNQAGKEIVVYAGSIEDSQENRRFFLEFKIREGVAQYHISERSLGFKWFFTFMLFTEFRKNRITDTSEILFLLDEPASNLHSTAQINLLNTFKMLTTRSILVYTTHSHHLINPDWLEGAFIVRNKGLSLNYIDGFNFDATKTDIEVTLYKQFVSKYPTQTDYFQPILDSLEYKPGLLERIPSIIIVEGKTDYYVFNLIKKTFFPTEYESVSFYPGAGANSNYSVIRLYLSWGRNFFILLDSDDAGEKAKRLYVKEFGPLIENYIFTYSDIDFEFGKICIEDLFNEVERNEISKAGIPSIHEYDKSAFHKGIQMCVVKNETIQLASETINLFRKVFRFFENIKLSNE